MGFDYTALSRKRSGIPDGWCVVAVGDVSSINELSIESGYPHETIDYIDIASVEKGGIDSVQALPLRDAPSRAKRIVRDNDILISTVRPNLEHYAFIKRATPNTIASTGFATVTAENVDPRYLYYYLTTRPFTAYLSQIADSHTSAYPAINPDVIETAELLLPPSDEQRAIARILGTLDDKIELNRRMNQTLEAMAQALFKSWFVDFDPFRDHGMQDSLLGEIPMGWKHKSVAEAIAVNPSRRLDRGSDAIYVDMSSLPTASARVLDIIRRPYSGSGSRFADGDVLLARITPCLENGKTALVDFLPDGEIGWGSTEFTILGPKPPVGTFFIYCLARHHDFRIHAIQAMTGTSGRQRVDTACFAHYWLPIPQAGILLEFEQQVNPWFQKMKANDLQCNMLASIRDTLLPKLLSGEIRVRDAEKFVEKAL